MVTRYMSKMSALTIDGEGAFESPQGILVMYADYAILESHLSAIAVALGVPNAEPSELAGMVRDTKEYLGTVGRELESVAKERGSLRSQRDMLVKTLEKLEHAEYPIFMSHIPVIVSAALVKVREEEKKNG